MTPSGPLDAEAFLTLLREIFPTVSEEPLNAEMPLDDLAFDSLMLFEVIEFLSELAGHDVPDELIASLKTAGDIYDVYVTYYGRAQV